MMSRTPLWALAFLGSLGTHAAAFAGLLPFLRPDPPPKQPSPESSLTLAAQQVPRSDAVEQSATVEPGEIADSHGDHLASSAVPESQARPVSAQSAPISASKPEAGRVASQSPPAVPVTDSRPVAAQAAAIAPDTTHLTQRPPTPQPLADSPADGAQLPDTIPVGLPTLPNPPQSEALVDSSASDHSTVAAQAPGRATQITASLAFQGSEDREIDPVSVAAFQSFTRPEDLAASATGLRDGLSQLLSTVPCSRLQVAFDPDTATLELRGHLPEDGLRGPVMAALQGYMGRDISLSDKMRLLPRPQCGALSGISSIGLPQSTDQITNPLLLGSDAQARVLSYSGGEQLFFELTAPDYPAYLYVDYFDAAGNVIHLSPNEVVPLNLAPAKSAQRVGAKNPDEPGLLITVGPPYGQEIAVAFAASSPLYEDLRPLSEPAAPYLSFLRERVTEKRAQNQDFKGEWVYFLVETQAQ